MVFSWAVTLRTNSSLVSYRVYSSVISQNFGPEIAQCHVGGVLCLVNSIVISVSWGHIWSSCAILLSVRCSWHHPRRTVGSCEWFPLGYRRPYRKIQCNIAVQVVLLFCNGSEFGGRLLHFFTCRQAASDWCFWRVGKVHACVRISPTHLLRRMSCMLQIFFFNRPCMPGRCRGDTLTWWFSGVPGW